MDGRQKLAKFPPRENLRQRIQKFCQRTVPRVRLGEFPHIHLALPRRQRIGAHFAKHQGLDRINAHDKCFTLRRSTTSRKEKLISAAPTLQIFLARQRSPPAGSEECPCSKRPCP